MGDLGGAKKNGVLQGDHSVITNPDPSTITNDLWAIAEEAVQEVINSIHPNLGSEEKRKNVIDYMQRLFKCTLGLEVVPFGSVPLKTYLPDGDIDLTVLSSPGVGDYWFSGVLSVLQGEEHNQNAEYEIKDTQFIDAEVKVVKCLVKSIVIDISFNQLGGISTLCFLEKVDQFVGKDHLFKRSIILIKSWCYYESRILASNHGLLSTYAVETLVLCIFQLFHSSLDTPFAVLYRFLDYFSNFDWENYGISVKGPFRKSSLPDIVVVEMPENHANNLLLDEEFFKKCIEIFTIPPKNSALDSRVFQSKHLNIIDPLKDNNNLGRSVHRGNFYRIRSALKYGARKLGGIMSSPAEGFGDEIKKFFSSTLQRHIYKSMWDSRTLLSNEGDGILVRSSRIRNNNGTSSYDYAACNPVNGASEYLSNNNVNNLNRGQYYFAPLYEQRSVENGPLYETELSNGLKKKVEINQCCDNSRCNSPVSSPKSSILESLPIGLKERDTGEPLNPLSDLTGEFDSHIRSLSYWKCCQGLAFSAPMVSLSPALHPMTNPWEPFHQPFHYNIPNSYPYANSSPSAFIEPCIQTSFYAPPEGNWNNNQGTGFPPFQNIVAQVPSNRDRGKAVQPQVDTCSNSYVPGFVGPSEVSKAQVYRKTGVIFSQSSNPKEDEARTGVNLTKPSSEIEFGSLGTQADDKVTISGGRLTALNMVVQDKEKVVSASRSTAKQERVEDSVFYLKEEEFPVLSVKQ